MPHRRLSQPQVRNNVNDPRLGQYARNPLFAMNVPCSNKTVMLSTDFRRTASEMSGLSAELITGMHNRDQGDADTLPKLRLNTEKINKSPKSQSTSRVYLATDVYDALISRSTHSMVSKKLRRRSESFKTLSWKLG